MRLTAAYTARFNAFLALGLFGIVIFVGSIASSHTIWCRNKRSLNPGRKHINGRPAAKSVSRFGLSSDHVGAHSRRHCGQTAFDSCRKGPHSMRACSNLNPCGKIYRDSRAIAD
jgi:hypothetical protein